MALAESIGLVAAEFLAKGLLTNVLGSDTDKVSAAGRIIEKVLTEGFAGVDLSAFAKLAPPKAFEKAQDAITKIKQKLFGVGANDASLSKEVIDKILKECLGSLSGTGLGVQNRRFANTDDDKFSVPDDLPTDVKAIVGNAGQWIVYRIRNSDQLSELRNVGAEAENLIDMAFITWQKAINLRVLKTEEAAGHTNLDIVLQPLDGTGGVLADATVGNGPAGTKRPYQLRIDLSEEWTREKFVYALVHEIGHLLGLDHTEASGDIMNSTAPADPTTVLRFGPGKFEVAFLDLSSPSVQDAQSAWGPAPFLAPAQGARPTLAGAFKPTAPKKTKKPAAVKAKAKLPLTAANKPSPKSKSQLKAKGVSATKTVKRDTQKPKPPAKSKPATKIKKAIKSTAKGATPKSKKPLRKKTK